MCDIHVADEMKLSIFFCATLCV